MPLPKQGEKKIFCFGNCGNGIAENEKKKKIYIYIYICFGNCGNVIAENGKKKKNLFWQLWQWDCRKWKKKMLRNL